MSDPRLHWLLIQSRRSEMERRGAEEAKRRPPVPHRPSPASESAVTLRYGFPDDASAIARLAALDCAPVPPPPLLLAELEGELWAVLSLSTGTHIADPFHATTELLALLRTRAVQLDSSARSRRRPVRAWLRQRVPVLR